MRTLSLATLLMALGAQAAASTPACGSGIHFVIGGKYYPASEFNYLGAGHAGCVSAHYHAQNGSFVTATDSSTLFDPDSAGCGYGSSLSIFDPCATGGSFTPLAAPDSAAGVLELNFEPPSSSSLGGSDPARLFVEAVLSFGAWFDDPVPLNQPASGLRPDAFEDSYRALDPDSEGARDASRREAFEEWGRAMLRNAERRNSSLPRPASGPSAQDAAAIDPAALKAPGGEPPQCGAGAPSAVPSLFKTPGTDGATPPSQQVAAVSQLTWLESFQRERALADAKGAEDQAGIQRRQARQWREIAEKRREYAEESRDAGKDGEAEDWDKEADDAERRADELEQRAERDEANADQKRADAERLRREAEQRAREKAEAEQRARDAKEQARLQAEQEAREKEQRRIWEERRREEEARRQEQAKRDRQAAREREAEERRRKAADEARQREQRARQQREALERRLRAYEQWEQRHGRPHPRTTSTRDALAAAGGVQGAGAKAGDPNALFKSKGVDVGAELAGEMAGLRVPGAGDAVGGLVTLKNVSEFGQTAQRVVDRGQAQNAAIEKAMDGVINGTVSPEEFRRIQNGAFFGNAADLLKAGTSAAY
jgi:hypothetical protein